MVRQLIMGLELKASIMALPADRRGATAVEYGLLIGLVAVGLAAGLGALADLVNLLFEIIGTNVGETSDSVQAG